LLDDLIARHVSITPSMGEVAALARLAFDCGGIVVAGPDAAWRAAHADLPRVEWAGRGIAMRRR
jgi:hypothetical protein